MKEVKLKPAVPVRSSALPWNRSETMAVLPPRNEKRYQDRGNYQATAMGERKEVPRPLVDLAAAVASASKGKARKLISAGKVHVVGPRGDGAVYDPDYVLAADECIVCSL